LRLDLTHDRPPQLFFTADEFAGLLRRQMMSRTGTQGDALARLEEKRPGICREGQIAALSASEGASDEASKAPSFVFGLIILDLIAGANRVFAPSNRR
jgi:hypothetical protein